MSWPLVNIKPYAVQLEALKRSELRERWAHFLEMRLGKTPVILAEFALLVQQGRVEGLVVVCPNSLKHDWAGQAKRFLPFNTRIAIWPEIPPRGSDPFVLAVNYEAFAIGDAVAVPTVTKALRSYKTLMVLDESIAIKGHDSIRTKALLGMAPFAAYRRILSGEPMVNGPHDLWAQFRFTNAIKSNYFAWRNRYCKMGGFKGKQIVGCKEEKEAELQAIIAENSFRARKEQWTDLPPKQYQMRRVPLSDQQAKMYREMQAEFLTMVDDGTEVSAKMVISQMMKLQQISSGFIIDADKMVHMIGKGPTGKIAALREIIEQATGKLIVFAHFKASIALLQAQLLDYKPAKLVGGMEGTDLEAEKARFNDDVNCRIIICQSGAAKYGHTLIGGELLENRCTTSVFYENTYDFDTRGQSEERNRHPMRVNQNLYIDLCASEQEEKTIAALIKKENLARAIMDNAPGRST